MPRLTGGEIVARTLKNYGIEHAAGVPGHGIWVLLDGFLQDGNDIELLQVFHEQSAVHMADGYYRATGKPMAAITSVGAGAANTILGLATAYSDSVPVLTITGAPPLSMQGHGCLQELERKEDNGLARSFEPVTKRRWSIKTVAELPFVLHRAFSAMLTGRPGPVHIEIPMDLQARAAEVNLHDLEKRLPQGRYFPDPQSVDHAAAVLRDGKRPVIVVGGGVISSGASAELLQMAEALQAPVVVTWSGKGAFPEDHPLFAGPIGQTGTIPGNAVPAAADAVLAVGCRFSDWSASSYSKGVTFSMPPGKLVQIDIEPHEIGKNYPVEVGIVADAKPTLAALADAVGAAPGREDYMSEIGSLKADWTKKESERLDSEQTPFTSQRPLRDLRRVMHRDGIIVSGSGNTQGAVKQSFPVYEPRTHLTSAGFSSMGWATPAAIGAKIGQPDRQVVCILGDGDFLMTSQEIGVAAQHEIPVVFVVQNNAGFMSIRGGQRKLMDRFILSEFTRKGQPYAVDMTAIGKAFGIDSVRIEDSDSMESTFARALASEGPTLIEVPTSRDAAGPWVPGWWDFPVPDYHQGEEQEEYKEKMAAEQHQ